MGFIPVLMITTISKKIKNKSLQGYINQKYGMFGKVLNMLLILIAIFIMALKLIALASNF